MSPSILPTVNPSFEPSQQSTAHAPSQTPSHIPSTSPTETCVIFIVGSDCLDTNGEYDDCVPDIWTPFNGYYVASDILFGGKPIYNHVDCTKRALFSASSWVFMDDEFNQLTAIDPVSTFSPPDNVAWTYTPGSGIDFRQYNNLPITCSSTNFPTLVPTLSEPTFPPSTDALCPPQVCKPSSDLIPEDFQALFL